MPHLPHLGVYIVMTRLLLMGLLPFVTRLPPMGLLYDMPRSTLVYYSLILTRFPILGV